MNDLLMYLLKVIAIQGILYCIYVLVFHKSGHHAFNRGLIVSVLVLSFILPLLSFPGLEAAEAIAETDTPIWHEIAEFTSTNNVELIPVARLEQTFSFSLIIIPMVLLSLLLVVKMIYSHFQLVRLMKQSESIIKNNRPIYLSKTEHPFSYFKFIFIPENLINTPSFDTILEHELAHVRKWHSLDRIFLEILIGLVWFNPFHYLFKNRLIEIHEFQADEEAISIKKDPIAYQEILYEQSQTQNAMAAANYFKLKTIKTRIKMINKHKKHSKWYYLLILPALALLAFSFSNKKSSISVSPLPSDVTDLFENVMNEQDDFTPSIFPLQDAKGVKLTTGVGTYIHPVIKVERMHNGIDLKTYSGNAILATANGIVIEASISYGGYGKKITIDHNGIYQTFYGHLSELKIKKGDIVKRGDIIGAAGTTGAAVEPHLHYEVRNANLQTQDPIDFIKNYDFKNSKRTTDSNNLQLGNPDEKLKVVIDAGHGGKDAGTTISGIVEKEIVIKVAQAVAESFENSNEVEIILTRSNDEFISLNDRARKSKDADLLISIHVDATPINENASNFMSATYYHGNEHSENSKKLTELIGREFLNLNPSFKAGITAGFIVLKDADCPAVSLSIGNISNEVSRNYMSSKEGMKEIAQKLSDVIQLSR